MGSSSFWNMSPPCSIPQSTMKLFPFASIKVSEPVTSWAAPINVTFILFISQLEYREESLCRHLHRSELAHLFLAFFLLF